MSGIVPIGDIRELLPRVDQKLGDEYDQSGKDEKQADEVLGARGYKGGHPKCFRFPMRHGEQRAANACEKNKNKELDHEAIGRRSTVQPLKRPDQIQWMFHRDLNFLRAGARG
jgi:hypothetical protein